MHIFWRRYCISNIHEKFRLKRDKSVSFRRRSLGYRHLKAVGRWHLSWCTSLKIRFSDCPLHLRCKDHVLHQILDRSLSSCRLHLGLETFSKVIWKAWNYSGFSGRTKKRCDSFSDPDRHLHKTINEWRLEVCIESDWTVTNR